MIECDGNKFRFIPEDVQLSQAEIESFVGGFNPLLSGAAALTAYWAKKDRESGESVGDPYVLLVVRPGGSMGFYTAKRMLRSLRLPIGYELVPDGRELDLPAADPVAAKLCRDAVETTLRSKDKIRSLQPLTKSLLAQVERDRARGFGAPPGSPADQNAPMLDDERARRFRRMVTQAPDPYSNGLPRRDLAFPPRTTNRNQSPSSRRKLGQFAPGQKPVSQVPPDPVESDQPGTANPDQPGRLPFFDAATETGRGRAQPGSRSRRDAWANHARQQRSGIRSTGTHRAARATKVRAAGSSRFQCGIAGPANECETRSTVAVQATR